MKQGTFCISWGEYGGFYFYRGFTTRLCIGKLAFTYLPLEIDDILHNPTKQYEDYQKELEKIKVDTINKTKKEILFKLANPPKKE